MKKLIKNVWNYSSDSKVAFANLLSHNVHPEGFDVDRIRFLETANLVPRSDVGHIISVIRGRGVICLAHGDRQPLTLREGVHIYIPSHMESTIEAEPGTEIVRVSGGSSSQSRGKEFLLRDEMFLVASAAESHSLRWVLTPQYLSRRIFLHHDQTLLSKSGHPVSWFRTTMFDVTGLPKNEEGESVFKMSYNSRTEFNVCYDVKGIARVRFAQHPYRNTNQPWSPWFSLDSESTYHLNEAAGSRDEECHIEAATNTRKYLRNKHEVFIIDGHVTLFCLFDPAPTGIERHRPGEYSDYEPLSCVLASGSYERHKQEIERYDEMVDQLSIAEAKGALNCCLGTPAWELYTHGIRTQSAIESNLLNVMQSNCPSRENVIAPWMQSVTV